MKKSMWKKGIVFTLLVAMLTSQFTVYAQEEDPGFVEGVILPEDTQDAGDVGDMEIDTDEPIDNMPNPFSEDETNFLYMTPMDMSFGVVNPGDIVSHQTMTVYNIGQVTHNIGWRLDDPDRAFIVDAPTSLSIDSAMYATFTIMPNTNVGGGKHTARLVVDSPTPSGYVESVVGTLSFTVNTPKPYVNNIVISPQNVNITKSSTTRFSATVNGGNGASNAVVWELTGSTSGTTHIGDDGTLYVGADEQGTSLCVKATSVQDPVIMATAMAYIQNSKYTVSLYTSPDGAGSLSGAGTYNEGDTVTIGTIPGNGYAFLGWYENEGLVSTNPQYVISGINRDRSLLAKFSRTNCRIETSRNNEAGGSVSDSQTVDYGGTVTIKATPNSGYKFDGWKENEVIFDTNPTLTITNIVTDHKIKACFSQQKYTVTASVTPDSTGKAEGMGSFNPGENCKLTATAYDGYEFISWNENGTIICRDPVVVVKNIKRDYHLVAVFQKKDGQTFEIAASSADNNTGTVSPEGKINIQKGGSVTYTITPKNGYRIKDVLVDDKSVGAVNSYSFNNVTAKHTLKASFVRVYDITASTTGGHGYLNPGNTVCVQQGGNVTYQIIPDNGYKIANVYVDGKDVGACTEYTFANVTADHTIQATFVAKDTNTGDDTAKKEEPSKPIELPKSDEELEQAIDAGIKDLEDSGVVVEEDARVGVLQFLNLSEQQAADMIVAGEDRELMEAALLQRMLKVAITNEYAGTNQETVFNSYFDNASLPNFEDVLDTVLTPIEKMDMLQGHELDVKLSIYKSDAWVDPAEKEFIESHKSGDLTVGQYFEVLFMKDTQAQNTVITTTEIPLQVVLEVPDTLKGVKGDFVILRSHIENDGTKSYSELPDEDSNPNTITFSTDRFSTYAISYREESASASDVISSASSHNEDRTSLILKISLGILIVVLIILLVVVVRVSVKPKRSHSKKHHSNGTHPKR